MLFINIIDGGNGVIIEAIGVKFICFTYIDVIRIRLEADKINRDEVEVWSTVYI